MSAAVEPADALTDGALPPPSLTLTSASIRWFVRLRWMFLGAAAGVLAAERLVYPDGVRSWGVYAALGMLGAANIVWRMISPAASDRSGREDTRAASPQLLAMAHIQVATDVAALTILLHFSGGVENPFAVFYVFHMAISALLLPTVHALAQFGLTLLVWTALFVADLSGLRSGPLLPMGLANEPARLASRVAQFTAVSCGIAGSLYLTLHIAGRLRRREAELERMNAALSRARTALQHIQERRSRFMQTAAHQLKSPLAAIQCMASLVAEGLAEGDAARQTASRIVARCRSGIEQVGELLTLARVQDDDPARHRRSAADAGAVLDELIRRYEPLAAQKRIELTCRVDDRAELWARVDRRDLMDCVGNLLDNAIKFTPEGGQVRVWAHRATGAPVLRQGEPHRVAIHVADTGIGMEPESLGAPGGAPGAVFDAFRRGNNALAAGIPGSGLGLAIVRVVVEQAGGRIVARSAPDAGTHFTVLFSLLGAPDDAPPVRDTRAVGVEAYAGPARGASQSFRVETQHA